MFSKPNSSLFILAICVCCANPSFSGPSGSSQAGIDPDAGQQVNWEGWSFKWQFRDIEGLVLTNVHFGGRKVLKITELSRDLCALCSRTTQTRRFCSGRIQSEPNATEVGTDCIGTGTRASIYSRW